MRGALLALLTALLLLTAGCAVFDREYYSEGDYEAPAEAADAEEDSADNITNYTALRRAIFALVSEHASSAQLQFQGYEGSIQRDLSTACWEVKSSTALGSFSVDYISYDLSRIVSYTQAEIHISYKRTARQTEAIEHVENLATMAARLDRALREDETYLVLELTTAGATAEAVRADIERAYYADPFACPVLPAAEVGIYPESGVDHILEISLTYGASPQEMSERRAALRGSVGAMTEEIRGEGDDGASDPAGLLDGLCRYLASICVYDPGAGGTAWDALTGGHASSEGLAMAFAAGCRTLDIDCAVVRGRMGNEAHAWNIVTVEGAPYHVDVTNRTEAFLVGDDSLWGAYWWDTSEYPACPEGYFTQETAAASGELDQPEEPA